MYADEKAHLDSVYIRSKNNCGVHTFIQLITLHDQGLDAAFSTEFIEKHSLSLRAWMIHILIQGIPGNVEWHESFEQFRKQEQTSNWFHKVKL